MKITLFMAMSLDGLTSRKNGSEDFLSELDWKFFCGLTEKSGCLITSRETYDNVKSWESESFDDIKNIKKIIVSHNKNTKLDKGYNLALSPLEAIKTAEKLMCKEAVLTAGPNLTKDFFREKLINEIIINIDPISVGNGIKLFQENNFTTKLKLLGIKKLNHGIVQLHYKVLY